MTRVEWTRLSGDDVEALISMFVCRENPQAYRVRPSSGDGGVDVCVPLGDRHVEIYQVKRFAKNLGSSEKQQIVNSHKRIHEYAEERGWTVDKWKLTLPLDRTPENDLWLEELESTGGIPCEWVGLSVVEGWAARYGDIVDYYLADGRARLLEDLAQFTSLSAIPMGGPLGQSIEEFVNLTPVAVETQLATLRDTLNARDPHFVYAYAVSDQPEMPSPRSPGFPALVASTARQVGESYVSFHVLARCEESVHERPITIRATIRPDLAAGSDGAREFEELRTYGRSPRIPLDVSDLCIDLPGGLGSESARGKLLLTRILDETERFDREFTIVSPEQDVLAQVVFTFSEPEVNHDNTGLANRGADTTGLLEIEQLSVVRDGQVSMTIRLQLREDPAGRFPDEVQQPLAFLRHFGAPNQMRVATTRGRRQQQTVAIPAAPHNEEREHWLDFLLRYVQALVTIQEHVEKELRVPDFDTEDFENARWVISASRMLDGEIVAGTWTKFNYIVDSDTESYDGLQQASIVQPLVVSVGGQDVTIGTMLLHTGPAEVTNVRTDDGGTTMDVVPALGDNSASLRWLPDAPAPQPDPSTGTHHQP